MLVRPSPGNLLGVFTTVAAHPWRFSKGGQHSQNSHRAGVFVIKGTPQSPKARYRSIPCVRAGLAPRATPRRKRKRRLEGEIHLRASHLSKMREGWDSHLVACSLARDKVGQGRCPGLLQVKGCPTSRGFRDVDSSGIRIFIVRTCQSLTRTRPLSPKA